ncbi:MAG TPA: DUF2480 family protein [Lacibacter sp.]|nr:DUF2480 family protein [Lacibacter sp.]HMO90110.1 DUF2480 family protein [Lacibacter sp.]HMP85733.1 DUF2480 family protein [Lacibacter sp.]
MSDAIVNRVAESALVTIDLETFLPPETPAVFDLKDFLFMGLILKEKDYREALKNTDWEAYRNRVVLVTCSADAILPSWSWMLAASYLRQVTDEICLESVSAWKTRRLLENIRQLDATEFTDKRIVIKGCGDTPIPDAAYLEITSKLQPVAKSILYGEPCSTVPVYKKK